MSYFVRFPIEKAKDLFCNEVGYQTPKLDTRAAIFNENRILLVKENGKWSLPGGWIDYNESISSNTVKEVKEEAGLDVDPMRIIAKRVLCLYSECFRQKTFRVGESE